MSRSGPELELAKKKTKGSVPYGPPQPEPGSVAARRSGSAGKTALKVGASIALPFLLRAVFKAATK